MRCYAEHAAVIEAAWGRVEVRLDALPPPLDASAADWRAHMGRGRGGDAPHRAYFSGEHTPPLLYLAIWLAESLSHPAVDEPTLIGLTEGMMWGYFAIRIQDDVLDEVEPRRDRLLLGNACLLEMTRAFRGCGLAGPDFEAALGEAFLDYSRLTLAEQNQLRSADPYPEALFVRHAGKVAYARVGMLAVAGLAERPDLRPAVRALVDALGVSYGFVNDLIGWERDLRNGHRTFLLARAEEVGGADSDAIQAALYDRGLALTALEGAREWLGRAAEIARTMDMAAFERFRMERDDELARLEQELSLFRLKRVLLGVHRELSP